MTRLKLALLPGLILALHAQSGLAQDAPAIEPKAIDALKSMGTYLRTLKTFDVRLNTTIDQILDNGQKVQFGGNADYLVQAPSHMRIALNTDRVQRTLYFDGKTLTQYAPRYRYYSSVAAPSTIPALLTELEQNYGIELPLADLFRWGTDKDGTANIKSAAYIGPGYVDGADCDHYAYRQEGVDWQIWIERGAKPLPRKFVITTTTEPTQPQYVAQLKWNLAPKTSTGDFTFAPPKDAQKIVMRPLAESPAKP